LFSTTLLEVGRGRERDGVIETGCTHVYAVSVEVGGDLATGRLWKFILVNNVVKALSHVGELDVEVGHFLCCETEHVLFRSSKLRLGR
jgi:hypothetical protein